MTAIYLGTKKTIKLKKKDLTVLKKKAEQSPTRRARLCLHRSTDDKVQEMVIAFCMDSTVPVHRHRNKGESFHIIEGFLEVLIYGDAGNLVESTKLGPVESGHPFMFKIADNSWHKVNPLSEYVIVHETTSGPFRQEDSETASFAVSPVRMPAGEPG